MNYRSRWLIIAALAAMQAMMVLADSAKWMGVEFGGITLDCSGQYVYAWTNGLWGVLGDNGKYSYPLLYRSVDYGQTFNITNFFSDSQMCLQISDLESDCTGQNLIASVYSCSGSASSMDGIYRSVNFGVDWTILSSVSDGTQWRTVSSDSSGLYLAVGSNTDVRVSSNSGQSWFTTMSNSVSKLKMSKSGAVIHAVDFSFYQSVDYGNSWSTVAAYGSVFLDNHLHSISDATVSDSSSRYTLLAYDMQATYDARLLTMSGGSLVQVGTVAQYNCVASDRSGQHVFAATWWYAGDGIHVSSDYGMTWTLSDAPSHIPYSSIASDSTGQFVYAVTSCSPSCDGSYMVFSSNFGANWTWVSPPAPTAAPTETPTETPTEVPSVAPTTAPSARSSLEPTILPTIHPSELPTSQPSSSSLSDAAATDNTGASSSGSSVGAIVGGVVGGVLGLVLVGAAVWFYCSRKSVIVSPIGNSTDTMYVA